MSHGQRVQNPRSKLPHGFATKHNLVYCACGDLFSGGPPIPPSLDKHWSRQHFVEEANGEKILVPECCTPYHLGHDSEPLTLPEGVQLVSPPPRLRLVPVSSTGAPNPSFRQRSRNYYHTYNARRSSITPEPSLTQTIQASCSVSEGSGSVSPSSSVEVLSTMEASESNENAVAGDDDPTIFVSEMLQDKNGSENANGETIPIQNVVASTSSVAEEAQNATSSTSTALIQNQNGTDNTRNVMNQELNAATSASSVTTSIHDTAVLPSPITSQPNSSTDSPKTPVTVPNDMDAESRDTTDQASSRTLSSHSTPPMQKGTPLPKEPLNQNNQVLTSLVSSSQTSHSVMFPKGTGFRADNGETSLVGIEIPSMQAVVPKIPVSHAPHTPIMPKRKLSQSNKAIIMPKYGKYRFNPLSSTTLLHQVKHFNKQAVSFPKSTTKDAGYLLIQMPMPLRKPVMLTPLNHRADYPAHAQCGDLSYLSNHVITPSKNISSKATHAQDTSSSTPPSYGSKPPTHAQGSNLSPQTSIPSTQSQHKNMSSQLSNTSAPSNHSSCMASQMQNSSLSSQSNHALAPLNHEPPMESDAQQNPTISMASHAHVSSLSSSSNHPLMPPGYVPSVASNVCYNSLPSFSCHTLMPPNHVPTIREYAQDNSLSYFLNNVSVFQSPTCQAIHAQGSSLACVPSHVSAPYPTTYVANHVSTQNNSAAYLCNSVPTPSNNAPYLFHQNSEAMTHQDNTFLNHQAPNQANNMAYLSNTMPSSMNATACMHDDPSSQGVVASLASMIPTPPNNATQLFRSDSNLLNPAMTLTLVPETFPRNTEALPNMGSYMLSTTASTSMTSSLNRMDETLTPLHTLSVMNDLERMRKEVEATLYLPDTINPSILNVRPGEYPYNAGPVD